eukprot:6461583-Amphidinium_carterae.2
MIVLAFVPRVVQPVGLTSPSSCADNVSLCMSNVEECGLDERAQGTAAAVQRKEDFVWIAPECDGSL